MWNLRYRRARPFVSFIALATVALSLTLYSPPAACEEEATGPEESETAAPSVPPEEDAQEPQEAAATPPKTTPKAPDCGPKPAWWTEEGRIIRQQGTASGPGCENATNAEAHSNAKVNATVGATVLTGAFGLGAYWGTGLVICEIAVAFDATDSECRSGPLAFGILGGVSAGFMGYKNEASIIMASSSVSLLYASAYLGYRMDAPDIMVSSMGLLGGVGGAYLGYRLWRVRQPTGPLNLFKTPKSIWSRTSLSPYLNRERSGLVLSGLF
jgi:hypothetical protein